MPDYTDSIRNFIETEMMNPKTRTVISSSESLIDKGIVDSLGIQILIIFLEKEFGIRIKDEEIIPENFDNLGSITDLVSVKLSGPEQ